MLVGTGCYVFSDSIVVIHIIDIIIVCVMNVVFLCVSVFLFQAEDGIRDLVRSRGLGDVYKRQVLRRVLL